MFTLGSDPEVFAWDSTALRAIPAYFAMGGDVNWELPHGMAYPDGAAIEMTVRVSEDAAAIASYIHENLAMIRLRLKEERGLDLSLVSSTSFAEYIPQLPEEFGKRASLQILGCNKDIRVYDFPDFGEIVRPDPKVYPNRTIGCHVHIGLGEKLATDWTFVQLLTAALDLTLGNFSVSLLRRNVAARERHILYGKSGTIRQKNKDEDGYDGVEYRVLPSEAVLRDEDTTIQVFETAQEVAVRMAALYASADLRKCIQFLGGVEEMRETAINIDNFNWCSCGLNFVRAAELFELKNRSTMRSLLRI